MMQCLLDMEIDELSLIDLEPNNSVTVTTQFDIPYDDQMEYSSRYYS